GNLTFFRTVSGDTIDRYNLLGDLDAEIVSFAAGDPSQRLLALGLDNGSVLLVSHEYKVTYPDDQRLITPELFFPYGRDPVRISSDGSAIVRVSAQHDGEQTGIAAVTENGQLILVTLVMEEAMLSDEVEITRTEASIPVTRGVAHVILDIDQRDLYVAGRDGSIAYYDTSDKSAPELVQRVQAVPRDTSITSLEFLSGGISILVGDSRGHINQWFPVRDEDNNYTLEKVRGFNAQDAPIIDITPEYFRKGFIAADASGTYGIYHTTAHRTVKIVETGSAELTSIAVAPRANALLVEDGSKNLQFWHVENEHPEISWRSIWGKVWYESRAQPEYIWQSSSASSDFEPKFSLTPLAFGTFKAAFYAMLFAIPLAIFGAMYTAYFMSPQMRGVVKPTIEIMEALPTVILGFLAGLWFAPLVEKYMPGLFLLLILTPIAILLASYAWHRMPGKYRQGIAPGWEAALLIPVIILAGIISFSLSQPLELMLFDGNMPLWITQNLGLDFDQRNSLVVGIAMGFAVIPTIFSISEDAVYSVPKHLTTGSLALGATPWQTMVRVVLLTASPGIFSAIMIGLGRAVGETMIVLMATGNTAIMDMNIFEGFRALSANIAVEMPESEVDSTHYRILFLAGLVLFLATFLFNTIAEVVRQRLRVKYSSL
ncbi:MAG: ABC transporter permease subunit, partial [Gammaproteobacteria bacterium]|nr:ABC transporter permease subunit [Gammaproteobacteria bacterium]